MKRTSERCRTLKQVQGRQEHFGMRCDLVSSDPVKQGQSPLLTFLSDLSKILHDGPAEQIYSTEQKEDAIPSLLRHIVPRGSGRHGMRADRREIDRTLLR